jgi:large subunit ribosomal protein L29
MNIKELREKSPQELNALVVDLHKEQFNLRVQKALQQPVKTHKFKEAKKTIARIKTILSEKGE